MEGDNRMSVAQTLLDLKEKIDEAKTSKNKLEGQRESLYTRLEESYKCKDLEAAQALAVKIDKQLRKDRRNRDEKMERIEKSYPW